MSSAGTNTERPSPAPAPERTDKAMGTPAQPRHVSASTSPMPQSPAPKPATPPPPCVEAKMQTEADLSLLLEQIDSEKLPSEVAESLHKILDEVALISTSLHATSYS